MNFERLWLTVVPADKSFNQAIFSVELYNVTWDFGPLKFSDITIVSIPFPADRYLRVPVQAGLFPC